MSKVAKNLFLEPEVIQRGAAYGAQHGTTLSRLVSDFLLRLPLDEPALPLSPAVQRLIGAALPKETQAGDATGVGQQDYHDYLAAKYGAP